MGSINNLRQQRSARTTALAVLLSLLVLPSGRAATPKKSTAREAPPLVDHILVEVSNMKASLAFYRDLLGLRLKSGEGDFVMLEAGNASIALWTKHWDWEAAKSPTQQPGFGMYPHFKVADAGAVVERARRTGYKIVQEPKKYPWGTEAFIADPDGYIWAIID
jgi:lactoylglutathione lyase